MTRIAESFEANRIAEVGTAEGWQFYNFCKYVSDKNKDTGAVFTCDPRDVRDSKYKDLYKKDDRFLYTQGTSSEMSSVAHDIEMFYIDGLHDQGTVLTDIFNLESSQNRSRKSVWVFDDFDERFGCAQDIFSLCQASRAFKVYKVGLTASGMPSHQAISLCRFAGEEQ